MCNNNRSIDEHMVCESVIWGRHIRTHSRAGHHNYVMDSVEAVICFFALVEGDEIYGG